MQRFGCEIAITGCSAVSAAGVGIKPVLEAVNSGTSCLVPIPLELTGGKDGHVWGRAEGFRASEFIAPLKIRKLDRASQFAVAVAGLALADAGIVKGGFQPERIGIALGCGFGGIANSFEFLSGFFQGGVAGLSPMLFPNTVANAPASNASIEHGLKGPDITVIQRFCSAESAILAACRFIEEGRADVMLAGGVDELTPQMIRGFDVLGQLRRFGNGFGEGSGMLVLERADHAQMRGVRIMARVAAIDTIGFLLTGADQQGLDRLLQHADTCRSITLSGAESDGQPLLNGLGTLQPLQPGQYIGRSLAMGGTVTALLASLLEPGETGLHLAASPQGPFYRILLQGGASD